VFTKLNFSVHFCLGGPSPEPNGIAVAGGMKSERNIDDGVDLSYDKHQHLGLFEAKSEVVIKPENIKQEVAEFAENLRHHHGSNSNSGTTSNSLSSLRSSISAGRLKFFKGGYPVPANKNIFILFRVLIK
jgi:hypothetical protein